jgi:TfoX/Sxy family transcriptional regulator of competence genes
MAYDNNLDDRIRKIVSKWSNTKAKKMFGGVCHLASGNMFCGVYKNFLILRLGENKSADALKLPFVRPFDITGKPMKGWVMVGDEGIKNDSELRDWLEKARAFVKTLPAK